MTENATQPEAAEKPPPQIPLSDGGDILHPDDRDAIFEEQPGAPTDIDVEALHGNFTYNPETRCFSTEVRGLSEGMAIRTKSTEQLPSPMVQDSVYYYRSVGDVPGRFLFSPEPEGNALMIQSAGLGTHKLEPLIRLRTFSFGAFIRAGKELGLTAVVGSMADMEKAPGDVILHEAMIIAWMQSSPKRQVREVFKRLREDPHAIDDAVDEFEDNLQFDDRTITAILKEVLRVVILAKVTWFNLIARQIGDKTPTQPADTPKNS